MNHEISFETAIEMTSRYRSNRDTVLKEEYQQGAILPICETFDKASIEALLSQTGAASLRVYYGMDSGLKLHAILVAADESDEDILPKTATNNNLNESEEGLILEDAQRCPPYCPPTSPLNDDN